MWNSFINTLKSLVSPKPAQSTQQRSTPAPTYKSAPTQYQSRQVPVYQTPKPATVYQSTVPQQPIGRSTNQGEQILTSSGWSDNPTPTFQKPSAPSYSFTNSLQNLVSNLSKPLLQPLQNAMSPLQNAMSTVSSNQLTKPEGLRLAATKAIGNIGKNISSFGTAIGAPQLAPGGFGAQLQNFAGNLLARPVQGAESTLRSTSKPAVIQETSNNTWRNPQVIAEEKAWLERNRGQLQKDQEELARITPQAEKMNADYELLKQQYASGKITQDQFMKMSGDLMGITQDAGNPFTADSLIKGYVSADRSGTATNTESSGIYKTVQDIYDKGIRDSQPILDKMWSEVEQGQRDYEDYLRQQDEIQKQAIISAYDTAVRESEKQIPLIEQEFSNANAQDQNLLDQLVQTLAGQKTTKSNTYDESLKQSVKNQRLEEQRLNNIFANLGTAESSSFIDRMTNVAQEGGANQAGIERQKLADLSAIDTLEANEKKNFAQRLAERTTNKDKALAEIRSGIVSTQGQKAADLANLTSILLSNLATGKSKATEAKQGIYNTQLGQSQKLQDYLIQYAINDQMAKNQSQYSTAALQGNTTIGNKVRPSGVPSDMWGLAAQLYSGGLRGADIVSQLKAKGGVGWNAWYDTLKNLLK